MWLEEKRLEIIRAYADSGMNVSAAARKVGVTTETVRYHLMQTQRKTGLDPRDFWDLVTLAALLGLRRKED